MKTTKKRFLAAAAAISLVISSILLSACGSKSPNGERLGKDGSSPNLPAVENDVFDDASQPEDQNPNTDDPIETAIINDAVVVSARQSKDSDRVMFECAAILDGYPGGYSPFTFSIPADAIKFKNCDASYDELAGKLVDIEFSGMFQETYPMGAAGVTKVIYSGKAAEDNVVKECNEFFGAAILDGEVPEQAADSVTISDAVVVYKSILSEVKKCSFSCVGSIYNSSSVEPFTFAVPMGSIVDESGKPVDPDNTKIVTVDIEFGGEVMDSYPAQLASVKRVVVKKSQEISKEQMEEYEKLFCFDNFEPDSDEQTAYIVDNAYVIRTEELWDGINASILAYAQMGTCGIKDLVEIIMPLNKIKDEKGNTVSVSGIKAGRCIEFAYTSVTEGVAGSPVFNVTADYLTVRTESVEVSEETLNAALDAYAIE